MQSEGVGELVNGAIPFFFGIYCTLLGRRLIGKKLGEDPRWDEWHNRFGGLMRVVGPTLIVFGLLQWVASAYHSKFSSLPR
jgi:hypothetical protein